MGTETRDSIKGVVVGGRSDYTLTRSEKVIVESPVLGSCPFTLKF